MAPRSWHTIDPRTKARLPERVLRLRIKRGLTRKQVAARAGVSSKTIQDIENEGSLPRADRLARIALALHTTTDYLTGLRPKP